MTTVTAASGTTTTLTPPSSSHGEQPAWKYAPPGRHDHKNYADYETNGSMHASFPQNGDSGFDPYTADSFSGMRESRSNSRAASFSDHKRTIHDVCVQGNGDENSKWIHRDKLAKIENEELQAAGIILPKPRAQSRPGRDRSRDKTNGRYRGDTDASEQSLPRPHKNSELIVDRAIEAEASNWDFRRPEEIAEDPSEHWGSNEFRKGSRIPVPKVSPSPLSSDYLDRDSSTQQKQGNSRLDEDAPTSIRQPRSRSGSINALGDVPKAQAGKRSTRDVSPRKSTTNGTRKSTTPAKSGTPGRPKTRSGPSTRSGSATRPTTRSGELSPKAPEGEPPWMVSAYKPDPRLPPDQQLLPTVAKRLQQEKWEQEGKFGNIYDKDFRPLNDDTFGKPPSPEKPREPEEQQAQQEPQEQQEQQEHREQQDEWPLRQDGKGQNSVRSGPSSYTTMPRIQDKQSPNPMGSPRPAQTEAQVTQTIRIPEPPEETDEKTKKGGCGCCIVM